MQHPVASAAVAEDDQVLAHDPHAERCGQVAHERERAARARELDDFVDVRIARDHRSGRRFDHVGEMRVRKTLTNGANRGRREDDVADLSQPHQKDLQFTNSPIHQLTNLPIHQSPDHQSPMSLFFYGGFINQHDRNVVLNRIHALARRALERRAVLDERHGRLAVGTRENLEKLGIDRHGRTI